ncbi:THAP domain-containing protein 5 isoform X2 [Tiliqua scincoides]|uniref:THAP domain-containing protein 5 isoform X2 n=1 Tax=Tiliqua scincoides TaxID=71010 RepID=UPI003461E84F
MPRRFPLHDKERLEKWLRNMRRDTWTPSKHQVLCSDHFTPDSLDVRWGIRYLKTTAVPTIFSSDNQGRGLPQKKAQEKRIEDGQEKNTCATATFLTPCSPKRNIIIEETLYRKAHYTILNKSPENKELLQSTVKTENDATDLENSIRQNLERTSSAIAEQDGSACNSSSSENHSFNHPGETLFSSTTTFLQPSGHELHSCLESLSDSKVTVLQATDLEHLESSLEYNTTVPINDFPPDQLNSDSAGCSVEVQQTDENSVLLQSVTRALEQFNGHESVITIIVPSGGSEDPFLLEGSFITVEQELLDIETEKSACITTYGGSEVLQTEHSYCRQDIDREQLWQKITKLNAKIALLEVQERKTLSRLKSLEPLIAKLKQENLLSEEKLKIVENCFTTFEVTMIQ